jgi:hypothetical protein
MLLLAFRNIRTLKVYCLRLFPKEHWFEAEDKACPLRFGSIINRTVLLLASFFRGVSFFLNAPDLSLCLGSIFKKVFKSSTIGKKTAV